MLLNDIGKSTDATFKRINQHLQANYGFKIAEDIGDKDLIAIMEKIEDEITDLKIKGDDAHTSPEISKRLLVLEGIRHLRESTLMQIQSSDFDHVINSLVEFVCEHFRLCGTSSADFDESIRDAMKHYRSSKYRFPDELVEQKVRQIAVKKINEPSINQMTINDSILEQEEEDMKKLQISETDPFGGVGKRASAMGGHAGEVPDTEKARHAMKALDNPALSLQPQSSQDEEVPMVRDKQGRMVPDPFKAHAAARRKGIAMKEHANLVKNLRRLLETEVSQAEVMMAAKGFAQELQEMVEKIGRLQNEDLPPVTDQMRETYGMESASAFQTQIYGALQSVMDSLYTAKGQVDDAVSNMASTGQVSASVDMDKDVGMDDEMGMDTGPESSDLDNLAADLDTEDEFGGAEEEEPLGRAMKEDLERKVFEMKKLVDKARKLKEAKK